MQFGPQMWNAAKPFYDQQTLAQHGDNTEQWAAKQLSLVNDFPHYERFWRYHVCPATNRPQAIKFRAGVDHVISVIAQRSYSVFVRLIEAVERLRLVRSGDFGPRNRNCYDTIVDAGNALQGFTELQSALCGRPHQLAGMPNLASRLSATIDPFPDWRRDWKYDRDLLSSYRNYIVHQGTFYSVTKTSTNQILVLKPTAFNPNTAYTWTHAEQEYQQNPANWMDIIELCNLIVNDTVAFLDLAYEVICRDLSPLLSNPQYQVLWGWQSNQPIPVMSAVAISKIQTGTASAGPSTRHLNPLTGKTSGGVDDSPGGSGTRTI